MLKKNLFSVIQIEFAATEGIEAGGWGSNKASLTAGGGTTWDIDTTSAGEKKRKSGRKSGRKREKVGEKVLIYLNKNKNKNENGNENENGNGNTGQITSLVMFSLILIK